MARLKGARLVTVPEPEKGLEFNIALIKQLTGGDTYTARYLYANPFEFKPEFKIFINTNHLPHTADEPVFTSGRVKIVPFDRHFSDKEQDKGLKQYFCRRKNKTAVLNWLVEGYRLLLRDGFDTPSRVDYVVEKYRSEADVIGLFLSECTDSDENGLVPTSALYARYTAWTKDNCFHPLSNRSFTMDIRRRYEVRRTGAEGRVVVGVALKKVEVA